MACVCRHAFAGHSCRCVLLYNACSFYVLWWVWIYCIMYTCGCMHPSCVCPCARVYTLSAVSQCARRGPVYLVFITKPFTEAPIRIKPLSAHTDHRTQPASECVCVCMCETEGWGVKGIICTCACCILCTYVCLCTCVCIYFDHTSS